MEGSSIEGGMRKKKGGTEKGEEDLVDKEKVEVEGDEK